MAKSDAKRVNKQSVALMAVLVLVVVVSGWTLVLVSTTFQAPPSDFVTLPNSLILKSGVVVTFSNVTGIVSRGVTVGVKGYLISAKGDRVSGASVYMTYYFQGEYRTQVSTTDQNGYFEVHFPMNWTGWLPVTITYFGDAQHKGMTQLFGVSGENLALTPLLVT